MERKSFLYEIQNFFAEVWETTFLGGGSESEP
jgi:hypothetical protein